MFLDTVVKIASCAIINIIVFCYNIAIQSCSRFPCEVRVRTVPLKPCRRHGKKRKDEEAEQPPKEKGAGKKSSQK